MDTLQKSNVLPVVGVIGLCVVGVVLIGLFGKGGGAATGSSSKAVTLQVPVTTTDHILGDVTAPVTIVEYADFQCPSCQLFSPYLAKLVSEEGGKVSVVYRYFTLPQHKNAVPAALAAEAAGLQGKFWEMHDMLFEKQTDWENLPDTTAVFGVYAQAIGLDMNKFTADVQSEAVAKRVKSDTADAAKNNLTWTPSLFVSGTRIDNPQSYEELKQVVEKAMAK